MRNPLRGGGLSPVPLRGKSDAAALALHEGYRATRWEQRMRALSIALQFYEHHLAAGGMGTWGDNARSQYSQQLARATREQLRLLELQKQLEQSTKNAKPPPGSPTGSSGGAAVALACDMVKYADGSDMMGSLRNPAAWNNVYGMRPTWGLVPVNLVMIYIYINCLPADQWLKIRRI
mgnify:CR=1 FL=1